jgi:hypothetical protein
MECNVHAGLTVNLVRDTKSTHAGLTVNLVRDTKSTKWNAMFMQV